jgi:hypothetical protein
VPITLRRIVDLVAITTALGLASGVGWHGYAHFEEQRNIKRVSGELRRFQQVLAYQSASGQTQTNTRGWPVTIDPNWFGGDPPRNHLLTPDRPWLEIAPQEQAQLNDPPVRMSIDGATAAFWYNPNQGIVRARVPVQISDEKSLAMYNAVNGTWLRTIHGDPPPPPVTPDAAPEKDAGESAAADPG